MKKNLLLTAILASSLTACGGDSSGSSDSTSDSPSARSVSTATSTQAFAANDTCPNGGIDVAVGIDENGNGALDADEIDNTQSICHGTNGADGRDGTNGQDGVSITSLINVTEEAEGEHCANGGARIDVGLDSDSSGVLDTNEITATDYLCQDSEKIAPSAIECADNDVCKIAGRINEDLTLTADKLWILAEDVIVGNGGRFLISDTDVADLKANGVTLTIEPGTEIQALPQTSLVITRGSKIMAQGTEEAPINFSALDPQRPWNGILIQGLAPIYQSYDNEHDLTEQDFCNTSSDLPCNVPGLLNDNSYAGGDDITDNSGSLSYITLTNATRYNAENDSYALTFSGVGSQTQVDAVYASNFKFGITLWGGGLNLTNLVLDSWQLFDYQDEEDGGNGFPEGVTPLSIFGGFKGNIQNVILHRPRDTGSFYYGNDIAYISDDQTDVKISNLQVSSYRQNLQIRAVNDASVQISNTLLHGYACLNEYIYYNTPPKHLEFTNIYSNRCETGDLNSQVEMFPSLSDAGALVNPEFSLNPVNWTSIDNGSGFTFTQTDYIGAVAPDTASENAWWVTWTPANIFSGDSLETSEKLVTYFSLPNFVSCDYDLANCGIYSRIDQDFKLSKDINWTIGNDVIVGSGEKYLDSAESVQEVIDNGVTLTIEAGTDIRFDEQSSLTISRGSKLMAQGTKDAPITMRAYSTDLDNLDESNAGSWKGLTIQGFAPTYLPGDSEHCKDQDDNGICNVGFNIGEAEEWDSDRGEYVYNPVLHGYFGGNQADDSSGSISYLRIIDAGFYQPYYYDNISFPAFSLAGVGFGTSIENIHIHNSNSWNYKILGGTANVKNVVSTPDSVGNIELGYNGNIQHGIFKNSTGESTLYNGNWDPTLRASNNKVSYSNVLLIGDSTYESLASVQGETSVQFNNSAFLSGGAGCFLIRDGDSGVESELTLHNFIGECSNGLYAEKAASESGTILDLANSGLSMSIDSAGAVADSTVVVSDLTEVDNGSDFEFEDTDYMGAVKPGTTKEDAWWYGWTVPNTLDDLAN
jgi:hypothetical protein